MADDDDLQARVDALEARVEALAASHGEGRDADADHESPTAGRRASLAAVSRRGLLSAAAGAVAGGATSLALTSSKDGVDDHVRSERDAHDASAIAVTPGGEIVATDVLGALGDLDARLAGLLPFSPDYLQDYAYLYDDFFGGSIASGQIGTLGWQVTAASGGSLAPASESVENMPGWYDLATGTSAGGSCALHLEQISLYGHPLFVFEARVVVDPGDGDAPDVTWRIGLHDSLSAAEPANGCWFEGDGGGAVRCRTARGGRTAEQGSGGTLESGTAHRLRVTSDGGGAAYFSIDDESLAVARDELPAEATESFGPVLAIVNTAPGVAARVRVDYVYLLWSVSR